MKRFTQVIALACIVIIPVAFWLAWNKRMPIALVLMLGYAITLGITWWREKH